MSDLNVGGVGASYFNQRLDALKTNQPKATSEDPGIHFEDGLSEFKRDFDLISSAKPDHLMSVLAPGSRSVPGVGSLRPTADGCVVEMTGPGSFGLPSIVARYVYNREKETVTVTTRRFIPSEHGPGGGTTTRTSYVLNLKDRSVSDFQRQFQSEFPLEKFYLPLNDGLRLDRGHGERGIMHTKMLTLGDGETIFPKWERNIANVDRDTDPKREGGDLNLEHVWPMKGSSNLDPGSSRANRELDSLVPRGGLEGRQNPTTSPNPGESTPPLPTETRA